MAGRGIGRGLAAILPNPASDAGDELRRLPVEMIRPNAAQPRRRFSAETIAALAESISAAGVIQPLLVHRLADGTYELIAGERRWRAAREAGLETVPALIRDEDEAARLQTALIENVAREDLNPVDEARACAALVEDLGVSKQQLAGRLGRSRAAVSNLIRLLDLPDAALDLLESGELSEGHGRAILQAKDNDSRRRLAIAAARAGWSVRDTERRAKGEAPRQPAPAPHPDQQAALQRAADALERTLGREVAVRLVRGELRAELRFSDLQEALAFAAPPSERRAA